MARKVIEKEEYHPDTYRLNCDKCGKLFEAENVDFRYGGGDSLICKCPWCNKLKWIGIRALRKKKIRYASTYMYVG